MSETKLHPLVEEAITQYDIAHKVMACLPMYREHNGWMAKSIQKPGRICCRKEEIEGKTAGIDLRLVESPQCSLR